MGSEKRKLHSEIDRCIKRIQEGVEDFDEIWAKVQEAVNANQKEKYETDLKKEIKKLQRLREQIKGWLNSADIKDKSALQEYRRVIEQKMEQFKVVERETKTKAYSKQGLGAEQKMDPKEKEKEDTIGWLQECIDRLSQQNDKFESEIEQLSATVNKKKKLDKDKQDRLDELKRHLERHRFHVLKLELLMRLLTNNSLESVQVLKIREDLEYYITNNQEEDFEENDFMYDDLNLGDVEQLAQQLGTLVAFGQDESENNSETTSVSLSASPAPSQTSKDSNKENEDIKHRHASGGIDDIVRPIVSRTTTSSFSRSTPTTPLKLTGQLSVDSALSTPPSTGTPPLPATASINFESKLNAASFTKADLTSSCSQNAAAASTSIASAATMPSPPSATLTPTAAAPLTPTSTAASSSSATLHHGIVDDLARLTSWSSSPTVPIVAPPAPLAALTSMIGAALTNLNEAPTSSSLLLTAPNLTANGPVADEATNLGKNFEADEPSVMPLKLLAEKVSTTMSASPSTSTSSAAAVASQFSASNVLLSNNMLAGGVGASMLIGFNALSSSNAQLQQQQQQSTQEAKIPPLLGASPLGKTLLTQEHLFQMSILDNAMHHMPMPADSERLRTYLPRSSCPVPPHYPQAPPLMADALEYFNHLQPETLFFIFYYLEGTKAQYLAAKALKRQSWRFHTKYMMWFQRHEEPKAITEEYEQGTYIYFDFEKWAQRKKEGFTFEYKYLEDKELS